MWPNFDGKPYTRNELEAHIRSCDFSAWRRKDGTRAKPAFITLHNTSSPTIQLWLSWSPQKRQQYILNMQPYYERLGWRGGPHFFVPPQDDICAFGFNDLMAAGTHASCFNNLSIGIEMVGEFEREAFDTGPGATVADNAIYLMALLHNKIGITPAPYAYGQRGLHFHVECRADNHDCPGHLVQKPDVVERVSRKMQELAAPAPAIAMDRATGAAGNEIAAATESTVLPQEAIERICHVAAASNVAFYDWKDRGRSPMGYVKGMAVVYAVACAKLKSGDPAVAAMAASAAANSADALSWYRAKYAALNIRNDTPGRDTLRHLFVLLMGLGMRESSGKYCTGRDTSADNTSADTAEAGLFQMSWNAHVASPLIKKLFDDYTANPEGFLSIFQEGANCTHGDYTTYGEGDGAAFQQLCKTCPAFAVESAAVGLRFVRSHWGPINSRAAELRPEADKLFQDVESLVDGYLPP